MTAIGNINMSPDFMQETVVLKAIRGTTEDQARSRRGVGEARSNWFTAHTRSIPRKVSIDLVLALFLIARRLCML